MEDAPTLSRSQNVRLIRSRTADCTHHLAVSVLILFLTTLSRQSVTACACACFGDIPDHVVLDNDSLCTRAHRCRAVSSGTAAVARCWHCMDHGSNEYSQLEEGRSKLLLSTVPPGLGASPEVQRRLTLWEARRFEELPHRAEEHLSFRRKPGEKKKKHDWLADASSRADRARRTAAVGACRKATTGLVSSMLSLDESEDLFWAKGLLPSSPGAQAYCDPQLDPPPPDEDWDRPFAGVHCAALTAPGSTGIRPEHITDLLGSHCPGSPILQTLRWLAPTSCHVAHAHSALLATHQKRQAGDHQDGRTAAFGLRPAARESAPRSKGTPQIGRYG